MISLESLVRFHEKKISAIQVVVLIVIDTYPNMDLHELVHKPELKKVHYDVIRSARDSLIKRKWVEFQGNKRVPHSKYVSTPKGKELLDYLADDSDELATMMKGWPKVF